LRIIGAAACFAIEQLAADAGKMNVACIFIFKLNEAATATAIAQAFPFHF
jgi:hypothetical protein